MNVDFFCFISLSIGTKLYRNRPIAHLKAFACLFVSSAVFGSIVAISGSFSSTASTVSLCLKRSHNTYIINYDHILVELWMPVDLLSYSVSLERDNLLVDRPEFILCLLLLYMYIQVLFKSFITNVAFHCLA